MREEIRRIQKVIPTKEQLHDFWKEHHHRMAYIAVFFVVLFTTIHVHTHADVGTVNLYPTNCHGGWQNPDHMTGTPDVLNGGVNFSDENSAVPQDNPSHVDCAGFTGDIPNDVLPKKITARISWGVENEPGVSQNIPVSDDASSSTDASPVLPEIENKTMSLPTQDFLGLEYTLDGVVWQNLGVINADNYKNIYFEINNPEIVKWENLSNLQIRVKTLLSDSDLPHLYIDSVYLQADYEEIPKIIDPPKIVLKDQSVVLDGKADFGSDEVPTFVVTDPGFTTGDIQALVNTQQAQVLEDRNNLIDVSLVSSSTDENTSSENATNTDMFSEIKDAVVVPLIENVQQTIQKTDNAVTSFLLPAVAQAATNSTTISEAEVLDFGGNPTTIPVVISNVVINGITKQKVSITKPSRLFRPGKYTLKLSLNTPQAVIVSQQDFTWGVLTINTDKSIYTKGDSAYIQMGVINDHGHTICDADMTMTIVDPNGKTYPFSTANNSIERSKDCRGDSYVLTPDYFANFKLPLVMGEYTMNLTAVTLNGSRTVTSHFDVEDSPTFDVARVGPTRIYPVGIYPVTISVTSVKDWNGTVIEKVPASFDISQNDGMPAYDSVIVSGDEKIISWSVDLKSGETQKVGYYFKAPEISPEFYLLGPISFYDDGQDIHSEPVFQESRQWQIADDATCSSTAVPGTYNWNTGANWSFCSGALGVPGTNDNITIAAGVIMIMNVNSPVLGTITVNGTLYTSDGTARSLSGTTLTIGSAGKVASTNSLGTAAASTITLSGTSGTLMTLTPGGIFTGSTGTVTITGVGSTTLNSGAFTGSNALNNFTMNASGATSTLSADITMNGTATISLGTLSTSAVSNYAMSVGNFSIANTASATFLLNNSTLTLTGTSGTLITKTSSASTFTAGSSSTVVMNGDGAVTPVNLSGTLTLANLTINPTITSSRIYTFSGGTTLTITGNLMINPSASSTLSLTVLLGSTTAVTGTTTVTGSSSATSNLSTSSSNISFTTGLLSVSSVGTFTANASSVTISGTSDTPFIMNGTFSRGTSTVNLTGSHATTSVQIPAITFYNLVLNKSGETFVLLGATTIDSAGTLTITNGTLDTTVSNYAITAGKINIANSLNAILTANGSTITLNGTSGTLFTKGGVGVFTAGTSTIVMNSDAAISMFSGTPTLYNLTVNPVLTTSRAYSVSGGVMTINGDVMINPSGTSTLVVTMSAGTTTWTLASNKTITIQGTGGALAVLDTSTSSQAISCGILDIEAGGTLAANNSTITLSGTTGTPFIVNGTFTPGASNTMTFTGNNTGGNTSIPSSPSYVNITLNNASETYVLTGTTTLATAGTLVVTLGTLDTTASNFSLTAGKINVANSTSSTFLANSSNITLNGTSGTLLSRGANGTFTAASSTISFTGEGTVSLFSNTFTLWNVTVSPVLTNGCTYTWGGGAITVNGDLSIRPRGTGLLTVNMVAGVSTVVVASNKTMLIQPTESATVLWNTIAAGQTINAGTLDIEAGATLTITGGSAVNITGTTGIPFIMNGTFNAGTGTVTYSGNNASGNTAIASTPTYYSVTLNNSSETYVLGGNTTLSVSGTFSVTAGIFGTTANNYSLTTGKLNVLAGATFNANASTITLNAISGNLFTKTSATINYGTAEFIVASASGSPSFNPNSTTVYKLTINSTATVINLGNPLTIDNVAGARLYVQSGVLNDGGQTITAGASAELKIDNTGTLCLGGAAAATNATCDSSAVSTTARGMPTFGTYTFASSSTLVFLSDAALSSTHILSSPTYGNIKFTPKFVATNRTYTPQGALTVAGNLTIAPTNSSNTLTVNLAATTTVTGAINITPATASTTLATLSTTASNFSVSAGSIDIESGGTLTGNASTITVSGNWTNNGTFTQGTSTVLLNSATTATVSGTTTFYKFSIIPSGVAKEVDFATSSTPIFHVTNTFTATGATGALVKLRSVTSGTQWQFHPTGTASVTYVDVKDGGCQSGSITMTPTTSLNNGNNDTCWGFVPYLTFAISSGSVGFGNLNSSGVTYATSDGVGSSTDVEGNNITVVSYAIGGYSLTVLGSPPSYSGHTITAMGNANIASIPGTEQFGIRVIATGGTGAVQAPYSGSSGTGGFSTTASTVPSIIASESVGDGVSTTYSVHYLANVASNTQAGRYTTTLTYILTGTF